MTRLASHFSKKFRALSADQGEFLTEDQMRAAVPAVFAEQAHVSRSDRYAYIPTIEVLRGLAREGFRPTFACQSLTRAEDRFGYTKHLLRFRRESDVGRLNEVPEIVGLNSHGGESSFQLFGGVFRFLCMNGMVCGDTFKEIRVRHSGNIVRDVIEGTYTVVESFDRVLGHVDQMKQVSLSRPEQLAFAEAASVLRLDVAAGEVPSVDAAEFNRVRRSEDRQSDLWTTFNRVQENAIRGGLTGERLDANNHRRRVTTRPINGIDQNIALNRALWTLAERMAEIKRAA